jgi:Family of unknown function (DUF6134)
MGQRISRRAALGMLVAGGAGAMLMPGRALANAIQPPKRALHYIVYVDGNRSGSYGVEFVPREHGFTAISAMSIRVEVAFITAYRYQQDGQEDWENGKLAAFEYVTNDDGTTYLVAGTREGDHLMVKGPGGAVTAPGDAMGAGFWNAGILGANQLVDPQTGVLTPLRVRKLSANTAQIAQQTIHGNGYALETYLNGAIWYDAEKHFLASSFFKEGHKIELRRG